MERVVSGVGVGEEEKTRDRGSVLEVVGRLNYHSHARSSIIQYNISPKP